jgi:prepilin-type N-terminal cleavage/methylation domain-containing protein
MIPMRTATTNVGEGMMQRNRLILMSARVRRGFTLVELLVVITIIGILIALLLPAIQAAREAARRMQCSNNLKQIGAAMHMHLEAKGSFPDGYFWRQAGDTRTGGHEATWVTFLLPYIEQQSLFDGADFIVRSFGDVSSWTHPNATVVSTNLATMKCPSNVPFENIGTFYARGTYAANNGIGPMRESDVSSFPPKRTLGTVVNNLSLAGAFYLNSRKTPADFKDGLSNTAFVSEIRVVPGTDFRGMMHYSEGIFYHHNYTPNCTTADSIRSDACVADTGAPCNGVFSDWQSRVLTMSARSSHPGGVNLLLGDGSCTFIGDSIALNVWHSLCTPEAIPGEVVSTVY